MKFALTSTTSLLLISFINSGFTNPETSIEDVSREMIVKIFSHISPNDLPKASRINRLFYDAAQYSAIERLRRQGAVIHKDGDQGEIIKNWVNLLLLKTSLSGFFASKAKKDPNITINSQVLYKLVSSTFSGMPLNLSRICSALYRINEARDENFMMHMLNVADHNIRSIPIEVLKQDSSIIKSYLLFLNCTSAGIKARTRFLFKQREITKKWISIIHANDPSVARGIAENILKKLEYNGYNHFEYADNCESFYQFVNYFPQGLIDRFLTFLLHDNSHSKIISDLYLRKFTFTVSNVHPYQLNNESLSLPQKQSFPDFLEKIKNDLEKDLMNLEHQTDQQKEINSKFWYKGYLWLVHNHQNFSDTFTKKIEDVFEEMAIKIFNNRDLTSFFLNSMQYPYQNISFLSAPFIENLLKKCITIKPSYNLQEILIYMIYSGFGSYKKFNQENRNKILIDLFEKHNCNRAIYPILFGPEFYNESLPEELRINKPYGVLLLIYETISKNLYMDKFLTTELWDGDKKQDQNRN